MHIPTSTILESERYLLRIPSEDDIPFIFSASRVKGFNDGLGWDPMEKLEDHLVPHAKMLRAWDEGRGYSFAITLKSKQAFLGRISIRKTDEKDVWNIGFWTHPDHQKRGVMTTCVSLILKFGFEDLKAVKIEAEYATLNKASCKVLTKNGFRHIRHVKQGLYKNGKWHSEEEMAITRSDWESK